MVEEQRIQTIGGIIMEASYNNKLFQKIMLEKLNAEFMRVSCIFSLHMAYKQEKLINQ